MKQTIHPHAQPARSTGFGKVLVPVALLVASAFAAIGCTSTDTASNAQLQRTYKGSTPLEWSVRFADSRVGTLAPEKKMSFTSGASWDYANFLFLNSLLALDERIEQPRYLNFVQSTADSFLSADGKKIEKFKLEDYNIDNIAPGRALFSLYKITDSPRYRNAIQILRDQLKVHPRTSEGGFWHKQRYPDQMWLDGLFMASPFYAEYGATFHEPADFDDVAKQIILVDKYTYDSKTGLYYHGWDESRKQDWANKQTGLSPNFWSRAIGWYAMAMVDVLDNFPKDHPDRPKIIAIFQKLIAGAVKYQDPATGLWWQVTDQGARKGKEKDNYLEATASCMFVYSMAKAINNGWLDRTTYLPAVIKGYNGIITNLIDVNPDGSIDLTWCCKVSGLGYGRDGSFDYYVGEPIVKNDSKGTGPFILAGIELDRLLGINTPAKQLKNLAPAASATAAVKSAQAGKNEYTGPWAEVPKILARVKAPTFPAREFPITKYGAPTDGKGDSTEAIRKAIEACNKAGGGIVFVPAGTFLTGPIHLKSNVNLHLDEGAKLLFHTDPARYMPVVYTRWEGVELMNFSPLIYAYGQENIAITGKGTLDGQASYENWWGWVKLDENTKPKEPLARASRNKLMAEANQPINQMDVSKRVYGLGEYIRPPFIQPYNCKNILIEGVTILRSPFWEINPVLCQNITVRGVTIVSHGPNNDGCDPESSKDILIENTLFDTGDDCIAIKSGRNNDGRRVGVASENIVIRNCIFKDGHGGVTIGSEISGDCRNVYVEDCVMDSPNLDRALRLKTNAIRGGVLEKIYFRNVEVGRVADAVIHVDFKYEEGDQGDYKPVVRDIVVENVTSKSSPRAIFLRGFPDAKIRNVTLRNCKFTGVEGEDLLENTENITMENVEIVRK